MAGAVSFVGDSVGLPAAANLSTLQHRFMKLSAAETINKATAAGDTVIGILQNKPNAAGKVGDVKLAGGSKLDIGGTVAAGDYLTSDANGKGVTTTTDTETIGAIALQAGVSGDTIAVLIVNFTLAG